MRTIKGETYKERLLLDFLRSPESIRSSCSALMPFARQGQLKHFTYHEHAMAVTADFVIKLMLAQYPTLDIPYHSRMRHFNADGIDRLGQLKQKVAGLEQTKSLIEVTMLSILLDAGAGMQWRYMDHVSNSILSKSEGLAAASYNLFMQGLFSSDPQNAQQVDAAGLQKLTQNILAAGLQVTPKNPLVGLDGRVRLLQQVGACIQQKPEYFGKDGDAVRLGNIISIWLEQTKDGILSIKVLFSTLLDAFSDIWPGRYSLSKINLGDVWPHNLNISTINPQGFIPLHKLTQWLCYSLIEPLESYGLQITDIDVLTGLPEYRNGGLFVDLEVLIPLEKNAFNILHDLSSEFVVEWRAMTVVLLDELAHIIRAKLQLNAEQLPLIKILQGGTWLAGRKIASELRSDGSPPFKLISDGTLF